MLTDVARLETGHTPSRKHPEYWGGDVPWIGIRDATGNHGGTLHKTLQYTNELGIRNSSARILPANTVCLSRTASVGYVVVMGVPMATSQDFVNWVCGPGLNHSFLKYVLLGEQGSFLRFASGTTHQTIYFPEVKAFHIALPPLRTQQEIADVLGSLDDRIDLLRQTSTTLESIAQALFKSWFVDFDPVRAKAEGREPEGMDAETAALFPDGYEESALGPIPNGWRSEKLGDICELTKGCSYKGDGLSDAEGAYMFNLGCFNAHRVFATERVKRYTGEYRPRHTVLPGDLIMANTDMTQARDILGRPAFVPDGYEPGFVSHHVFKVSPKATNVDLANAVRVYLFFALRRPEFRERAIGFATGTTVLALPAAAAMDCPACIPSDSVLLAFSRTIQPFLAKLRENERLAGQLADLRDTLLPRLISGKLRLPESEAQLNEALA
ncbi:restriction endonuclease subunit S [Cupriavidus metallidurans]